MYQNKVTLIGFLGSNPEVRTANNGSFTTLREYESKKTDTKQRVWEIRVASILKLDRAEKAAPEDQDHDEVPQEETAA
jgi:single-strand DNA-binding protein